MGLSRTSQRLLLFLAIRSSKVFQSANSLPKICSLRNLWSPLRFKPSRRFSCRREEESDATRRRKAAETKVVGAGTRRYRCNCRASRLQYRPDDYPRIPAPPVGNSSVVQRDAFFARLRSGVSYRVIRFGGTCGGIGKA